MKRSIVLLLILAMLLPLSACRREEKELEPWAMPTVDTKPTPEPTPTISFGGGSPTAFVWNEAAFFNMADPGAAPESRQETFTHRQCAALFPYNFLPSSIFGESHLPYPKLTLQKTQHEVMLDAAGQLAEHAFVEYVYLPKNGKPDQALYVMAELCSHDAALAVYNGSWAHNLANPEDYTIVSSMVGLAVPSGAVVVTQPDAPYDSWQALIDYIKANPDTVVAGAANGTPHEVRLKLLLREEGVLDKVRWISGTNNDISTGLLGGSINVGMLTETAGPQFMVEGKLKGLLYSNVVRNYAGKPEVVAALDAIPTVADIYGDAKAPELTCAWPMAFAGPGGMDEALADKICEVVSSIVDSPEYMERVKALGGTNTFQDFTRAEMREMMDRVDEQCKSFFAN